GSCRHNLLECASENCGHAAQDRIAIHQLLGQGKSRDDVIQYFITKYGGEVALAAPIDKGFNRLAWLLPYALGVVAVAGLALGAHGLRQRPGTTMRVDESNLSDRKTADLADKLEDELQKLD